MFNRKRLWSQRERNVSEAVCLQEYFLKGFVSMPGSWQSSCSQLSREWRFLFAAAFKVFNCACFIWKQKKIPLYHFHQNGNIWFGCKNSGWVLNAVCILLLLVLVCKVSLLEIRVPPGRCGTDLQNLWCGVCVRLPASCPASLPAFPSCFNWEQCISTLKCFLEKQYASEKCCLVKNVSNSKNAPGEIGVVEIRGFRQLFY